MSIEFDSEKSERNFRERGLSFELVGQFEMDSAMIKIDYRKNYNELRFNSIGFIGDRLYHLTFTVRIDVLRVISFRKANRREVNYYANFH